MADNKNKGLPINIGTQMQSLTPRKEGFKFNEKSIQKMKQLMDEATQVIEEAKRNEDETFSE